MDSNEISITTALRKEFALEQVTLVPLSGYYDRNFKVVAPKGVFFLKIYGLDTLLSITFQLDFMGRCTLSGFPVAHIIKTRAGESCFSIGEHTAVLQEFLPGTPVAETVADGELMAELGAVLGRMHQVVSSQTFVGTNWKKYPWDLSQFELVREDYTRVHIGFPKEVISAIDFVCSEWEKTQKDLSRMPKGVVHGDYHGHNILVTGKKVTAITDFGDALYSWYAGDVAIALAHLCCKEQSTSKLFSAQFLKGYATEFALSDSEILQLPLLVAMRATTVIVETAHDATTDGIYAEMIRIQQRILESFARGDLSLTGYSNVLS